MVRRSMVALFAVLSLFTAGCGGDEKCAVAQENCRPDYLKSKGLTGCCSGLSCQDSVVTPGARICR